MYFVIVYLHQFRLICCVKTASIIQVHFIINFFKNLKVFFLLPQYEKPIKIKITYLSRIVHLKILIN
jgi:hypothetical protein